MNDDAVVARNTTSFTPIYEADTPLPDGRTPTEIEPFVQQIKETADKLVRDRASRGDVKLLSTALKELRFAFKVFSAYRGRPKVTIFGSARTPPSHPAYQAAVEFGRRVAEAGFMVITGAASGIMQAGHEGAGREASLGVNIMLPFEQSANPFVAGDSTRLMNMKYFFTRKLMFLKESDAVALFPGGFGTHDEAFEVLTLIQTGKSHLFPIVMVDPPGGTYWKRFQEFIDEELLANGYISPTDRALYRITDTVEDAVTEITRFYRVYHSMRYVSGDLVLRLQRPPSEALLEQIRHDFADIVSSGTFEVTSALASETNEANIAHLPRLKFRFNRQGHGRLRMLIDTLNQGN